MLNRSQGFTLMELLVVVAITAILTLIAYPLYQDYIMRTHIAQAISETINFKADMYEAYASGGDEELNKYISLSLKDNSGAESGSYQNSAFKFNGKIVESIFPWVRGTWVQGKTIDITSFGYQLKLKPYIFPKNYGGDRLDSYIGIMFVVNDRYSILESDGSITNHSVKNGDPIAIFCGQTRDSIKNIFESVPVKVWFPAGCRDLGTGFNGGYPIRNGITNFS